MNDRIAELEQELADSEAIRAMGREENNRMAHRLTDMEAELKGGLERAIRAEDKAVEMAKKYLAAEVELKVLRGSYAKLHESLREARAENRELELKLNPMSSEKCTWPLCKCQWPFCRGERVPLRTP